MHADRFFQGGRVSGARNPFLSRRFVARDRQADKADADQRQDIGHRQRMTPRLHREKGAEHENRDPAANLQRPPGARAHRERFRRLF